MTTTTRAVVAGGVLLLVLTEVTVFLIDRSWALPVSAAAVAVFAVVLRDSFHGVRPAGPAQPANDDALAALQAWESRTGAVIGWADSSRAGWDRYLRPRLAREFMVATRIRDPAALAASGRMVFGDELWPWVDPQNVTRGGRDQPGPGRAALEEILQRLEQI